MAPIYCAAATAAAEPTRTHADDHRPRAAAHRPVPGGAAVLLRAVVGGLCDLPAAAGRKRGPAAQRGALAADGRPADLHRLRRGGGHRQRPRGRGAGPHRPLGGGGHAAVDAGFRRAAVRRAGGRALGVVRLDGAVGRHLVRAARAAADAAGPLRGQAVAALLHRADAAGQRHRCRAGTLPGADAEGAGPAHSLRAVVRGAGGGGLGHGGGGAGAGGSTRGGAGHGAGAGAAGGGTHPRFPAGRPDRGRGLPGARQHRQRAAVPAACAGVRPAVADAGVLGRLQPGAAAGQPADQAPGRPAGDGGGRTAGGGEYRGGLDRGQPGRAAGRAIAGRCRLGAGVDERLQRGRGLWQHRARRGDGRRDERAAGGRGAGALRRCRGAGAGAGRSHRLAWLPALGFVLAATLLLALWRRAPAGAAAP